MPFPWEKKFQNYVLWQQSLWITTSKCLKAANLFLSWMFCGVPTALSPLLLVKWKTPMRNCNTGVGKKMSKLTGPEDPSITFYCNVKPNKETRESITSQFQWKSSCYFLEEKQESKIPFYYFSAWDEEKAKKCLSKKKTNASMTWGWQYVFITPSNCLGQGHYYSWVTDWWQTGRLVLMDVNSRNTMCFRHAFLY